MKLTAAASALLAILVVAIFFPIIGTFFSQDDFVLIHWAMTDLPHHLGKQFGDDAHHFRPLTKLIYFAVTYRIFGVNASPYHMLSLLIHVANTLLVFFIMRGFRLSRSTSLVAAGVFGLSAAFFHTVAWISCIQQLAGALFMYASLLTFMRGRRWMSAGLYLLAVLSIEQTFLSPVFALAIVLFGLVEGGRWPLRKTASMAWPQLILLVAYGALRLWKGSPSAGISKFYYGDNIGQNLAAYTSAFYDFWPDQLGLILSAKLEQNYSHVLLAGLILYHIVRLRFDRLLFSLLVLAGTLFPAFFLKGHYFYYHTYVPALGAVCLLCLPVDDVFRLLAHIARGRRVPAVTVAVAAILTFGAVSWKVVRGYFDRAANDPNSLRVSFVLHRAIIARRTFDDFMRKRDQLEGAQTIILTEGQPDRGSRGGRISDVMWALGSGTALNVFTGDFDLEVVTKVAHIPYDETRRRRACFYDRAGHFYTFDEVMAGRQPPAPLRPGG